MFVLYFQDMFWIYKNQYDKTTQVQILDRQSEITPVSSEQWKERQAIAF